MFHCPSFVVERKTKALNKYLIGIVCLISMFSAFFVTLILGALLTFLLELHDTVILNNTFLTILPLILLIIGTLCGLYGFISSLITSYHIDGSTITKGTIVMTPEVTGWKLISNSVAVAGMVSNLDKAIQIDNLRKTANVIRLIRLNCNPDFVSSFFFTGCYRKRTYTNAVLIEETKRYLIYQTDMGRLKILKIYGNFQFQMKHNGNNSLLVRIFARCLILTCIFLSLLAVDLGANIHTKPESDVVVEKSSSELKDTMVSFGYEEGYGAGSRSIRYIRKDEEHNRTSTITIDFDKEGIPCIYSFEVYYTEQTYSRSELSYILSLMNHSNLASQSDIDDFLDAVESAVSGEYTHETLQIGSEKIHIGTSGGTVQVYN